MTQLVDKMHKSEIQKLPEIQNQLKSVMEQIDALRKKDPSLLPNDNERSFGF